MDISFSEQDLQFQEEIRAGLNESEFHAHVREKQEKGTALSKQDMIDFHPATAASYSILTLFISARRANLSPYFDIKDLLAVTPCFLFLIELKTNFLAGPSEPPILNKHCIMNWLQNII